MSEENKPPLILWSGGLDSTYLLWQHLKSGKDAYVCYIELKNNEEKTKREKSSRNKMKTFLRDQAEHHDYGRILDDITMECEISSDRTHEWTLQQPMMWQHYMQIIYNSSRHGDVFTGYVRGDDFWHIRHKFDEIVKLTSDAYFHDRPYPPNMVYPLEWVEKEYIVEEMNRCTFDGKVLYNMVTWCEEISKHDGRWQIKDCSCLPCTKMRKVLSCKSMS